MDKLYHRDRIVEFGLDGKYLKSETSRDAKNRILGYHVPLSRFERALVGDYEGLTKKQIEEIKKWQK